MDKKKSAFSFAEIMISLVVIGVISMLVIPNLLDNSTNRTNNTAAQKARYEVGQASLRLQTECPRFRCSDRRDADVHLREILPNQGEIQYAASTIYNDGNDRVIEVIINVDGDNTTDLSVSATEGGSIKDIDNCSLNDYVSGTGCTDNDITSFSEGQKDRPNNNNNINFTLVN